MSYSMSDPSPAVSPYAIQAAENRQRFIDIYKTHITREGADKLLAYLENSDFFTAPASTRYHGNYEGGLCQHSLNVYDALVDILNRPRVKETYGISYSNESIAIAALLHDLCKVNFYKASTRNVKDENGEWVPAQPQWDRSKVLMQKDGSYQVQYECPKSGMSYTLQTIVDHTPPKLALENVVNGLAKGPVDISDLEEDCKIAITLNGGSMSYREELTLSGDYVIVLQDEAGNLTDYTFTILPYFDTSSWIFFSTLS